MAFGLFGLPRGGYPRGPGYQYVAETKRMLFGEVGIDMFIGLTDSIGLAVATAD